MIKTEECIFSSAPNCRAVQGFSLTIPTCIHSNIAARPAHFSFFLVFCFSVLMRRRKGCWHWWITWGFCRVVLSLCSVAPTCVCIISGLWLIGFQCFLTMHWLEVFICFIIGRISWVKVMNIPFNHYQGYNWFRTLYWYVKIGTKKNTKIHTKTLKKH